MHLSSSRTCFTVFAKVLRIEVILLALSCSSTAAHGSTASVIPANLHGAWSTQLEYCGKDSDSNYFIAGGKIIGWEVTWNDLRVRQRRASSLELAAKHVEYADSTAVVLTIMHYSQNFILFQECEGRYCWKVNLKRCRRS
jgi:hypothetical protein